jgi:hypothetical protein
VVVPGKANPSHTRVMVGSLTRRARKIGAIDPDGDLVTIPRLPCVAGADEPPGWKRRTIRQAECPERVGLTHSIDVDRTSGVGRWAVTPMHGGNGRLVPRSPSTGPHPKFCIPSFLYFIISAQLSCVPVSTSR